MLKQKATCFVIDDDPDDIEIFTYALRSIDSAIDCVIARDGEDAIQQLNNNFTFTPDLIFLDLNMPRMDGIECLKQLKQIQRLDKTDIIIFSTSSLKNEIRQTLYMGASHFLTKPCSVSSLIESLSELLNKITNHR